MRTTRIMVLVAAGVLLAASLALAAGRKGDWTRCKPGERLGQSLGLTDEQKTQIKGICEKYRVDYRKVREESADRQAAKARAQGLREKMRTDIGAVLTPAQRDKLQQMRSESYKGEWHKGRRPGAPQMMRRISRELGLTQEQREKVRAIYSAHREEIRGLAKEARAQGADRERIRERAMALKTKVVDQVRPILTPEQREKLQALIQRWEQRAKS